MLRFALILLALAQPAQADDAPPSLVAHRASESIAVDGRLDDEAWDHASIATGFRQFEPVEGAAPTQPTEVRVAYTRDALYVGARMFDSDPDAIRAQLGRRDDIDGDLFTISIDGFADGRAAYVFGVNAAGVQYDGIRSADNLDDSWDAIWVSSVSVDEQGWTAEMRIPYSMLRFAGGDVQTWGVGLVRQIPRTSERLEWPLVPRDVRDRGVVQGYAKLTGIRGVTPRRAIQVTPYVLSGGRAEPGVGQVDTGSEFNAGADARIGLSPTSTLDLAFNPDFGQVESDPAELNLSAFETFFPERRPFFVEGLDLFRTSGDGGQPLYTRRIGQDAPIIGAAKLIGQTGGLSYGALGASTGDDFAPQRTFAAARLLQRSGASEYGAIATLYDDRLTGYGESTALASVADWNLQLFDDSYRLEGNVGAVHRAVPGEGGTGWTASSEFGRITGDLQWRGGFDVTSDRYDVNESGILRRTNTIGLSGRVSYLANGGQPVGRFQRVSYRAFFGNSFTYDAGLSQGFGVFAFADFELRSFHSVGLQLSTDYLFGGYDQFETRGLGANERPRQVSFEIDYRTDSRKLWQVSPEAEVSLDEAGRLGLRGNLFGRWRASDRVDLSASLTLDRDRGNRSWIGNEAFRPDAAGGWRVGGERNDPEAPDDAFSPIGRDPVLDSAALLREPLADGTFYLPLFGARDSDSAELTLRATGTVSPTMSLQLFSQLFATRGTHRDFDLLATPTRYLRLDTYPKRAEYSFASFQMNAVFRWEYRPGSTLFLVWTQSRGVDEAIDGFETDAPLFERSTTDQVRDVFGRYPTNVLLLKLSYLILR